MGTIKTGLLCVWQVFDAQSCFFLRYQAVFDPCSYPLSETGYVVDP